METPMKFCQVLISAELRTQGMRLLEFLIGSLRGGQGGIVDL